MARTLSKTLAPIVEELELDQPVVVTMHGLRDIVARHGIRTPPNVVAARLRSAGWLLPTTRRGVWEFAPGAHAGPLGHQDPVLLLRAAVAAEPHLQAALALGSAAWALGFADRAPASLDLAVPVGTRAPADLAHGASVSTLTSRLGPVTAKGVPCQRPETVLVHLASDPTAPRSWTSVLEWLEDLAAEADARRFAVEIEGRPRSVAVRAGYLLQGLRPDLAEPLRPSTGHLYRFGPRGDDAERHDATWRVLDYVLPSHPAGWAAAQ